MNSSDGREVPQPNSGRPYEAKGSTSEQAAAQTFDVRFMQEGKYSVFLFLPQAYHGLIGLVVAYWGNFEVVFNICLEALITAEAADGKMRKTSGWIRWSFKRRRKLFLEICEEWVAGWKPDAASQLRSIMDAVSILHSSRNMIAHGTYGYSIPPHSSVAQHCYALNRVTNEKMPFDEHLLKKVYHDVSHLTADLVNVFRTIGEVQGPHYVVSDSEILRIYHETVHPWNPNPEKRPK